MLSRRYLLTGITTLVGLGAATYYFTNKGEQNAQASGEFEFMLTREEWLKRLTPDQFAVLREEATERPNTSPLLHEKGVGAFHCAGCDLPLYRSETKYDSGTGWPSFYAAMDNAVRTKTDYKLLVPRTEAHCRRCGGHLGHVFNDGPKPTGKRHCINGVSLQFVADA